jgi:SUN domain-containing protein 1/2
LKTNVESFSSKPNNAVGNCWPFEGSSGNITVRLSRPIAPSAVTIDHISRHVALKPLISAPKDFKVWGYQSLESDPVLLGSGVYIANQNPIQTTPVESHNVEYQYIRLEILSNYGGEFTCLYRFRVHSADVQNL